MKFNIYQVDAFAEKVFEGNPAAVCPLEEWVSDDVLQKIAEENNLSETAFFTPEKQGFKLRCHPEWHYDHVLTSCRFFY